MYRPNNGPIVVIVSLQRGFDAWIWGSDDREPGPSTELQRPDGLPGRDTVPSDGRRKVWPIPPTLPQEDCLTRPRKSTPTTPCTPQTLHKPHPSI